MVKDTINKICKSQGIIWKNICHTNYRSIVIDTQFKDLSLTRNN